MTHAERIAAIRARVEHIRLPSAPWRWHSYSNYLNDDRGTVHAPCTPSIIAGDVDEYTGTFIAHARADIPYLLARVETLEAALGEAIEDIQSDWHGDIDRLTAIKEGRDE